eukprot:TRINITY_DN10581_c0_g1_i1.p1 TRINITY_DN10581_c0_g1~~TRINITY_DN10581_c0_g1_i1.p1  ORF type:complete len:712 (-),score=134.23 TRINITY_DN10581_c0_g1_i1:49-2184(-)
MMKDEIQLEEILENDTRIKNGDNSSEFNNSKDNGNINTNKDENGFDEIGEGHEDFESQEEEKKAIKEINIPKGNYQMAAALIDAAFSGRPYAKQMIKKGLTGAIWYRRYTNMIWIRSFFLVALLIFTFVERPSWCYRTDCSVPRDISKVMKGVKPIVLDSKLPKLNFMAGLGIELGIIICLWLISVLGPLFFIGLRDALLRPSWPLLITILCFVSVIDIIVSFFVIRTLRLSQIIRPFLLLIISKSIRRTLISIIKSLPPIIEILLLLFVLIGFYSWFGLLIWLHLDGQAIYNNIPNALSSTQTLLTTVNFPDVMIPFYNESWWSVVFFFTFMLIGFYFMLPLILAITYNNYKDSVKTEGKKLEKKKSESLEAAFKQLDVNSKGFISYEVMKVLFIELRHYSKIKKVSKRKSKYFLNVLDDDKDGKISLKDFMNLQEVLAVTIYSKGRPFLHQKIKCFYTTKLGRGFVSFITNRVFDYFCVALLIINLVFTAVETGIILAKIPKEKWIAYVELSFSTVYFVEMLLKIMAFGWFRYWRVLSNKFDGTLSIVNFAVEIIFFNPNGVRDYFVTRVLLLTRLLRLLSLLTHIPKFAVIFTIYGSLVGIFSRVIGVLVGIYYLFSFIGIEVFGGMLFIGHVDLNGSLYATAQYFCYNFNDFPNAIAVMWNMQLINNWNIMFDGVERVSSGAARIYFIVFLVVVHCSCCQFDGFFRP